jgi:pimeloyl-ACP methyl ester carboxylesterase
MAAPTSEGFLGDDIPFLQIGHGPPLVMVQGLSPQHDVPRGWQRRMTLSAVAPLVDDFTVVVVNRKRGLQPGQSMSDIAGHIATAIEKELGEPVFLHGTSTGGSVALQLALDRPDLVRRLVVVASAYRLGPEGRTVQAELARMTRAGDPAGGWAKVIGLTLPPSLRRPAQPLARLAARSMARGDPTDLLVTVDAEDSFDVGNDLDRITAPTLVIGGGKDPFYPRELFQATADGVQDGRAHIFQDWGHVRTAGARATALLTLGFLLAGRRGGMPPQK